MVLEAGDVLALIAARRFGQEDERSEDSVVGGLDADVAAVHGIEAEPEDDAAIFGGGQKRGQATGGMADDGDALSFDLGGAEFFGRIGGQELDQVIDGVAVLPVIGVRGEVGDGGEVA